MSLNYPIDSVVIALDIWKYCSGEQAKQPNIHKIIQSSLYSFSIQLYNEDWTILCMLGCWAIALPSNEQIVNIGNNFYQF